MSVILRPTIFGKVPKGGAGSSRFVNRTSPAFTIVELLIVIVVIGILAAISIVAYNGIQSRARDTQRVTDMANIKKALLAYNAVHGGVVQAPVYRASGEPGWGGWDLSLRSNWLGFLGSTNGQMPQDPINKLIDDDYDNTGSRAYRYYCYPGTSEVVLAYRNEKGWYMTDRFQVDSCLSAIPAGS